MNLLKAAFMAAAALCSFGFYFWAKGKTWERKTLRWLIVLGTAAKITACLMIYIRWPGLSKYSDALSYYFPQTVDFLSGKVPNRDFISAYSILFQPFLAVPVLIWRSVGSIVLTILLLEGGMIALYLRRDGRSHGNEARRAAFLYCFSPFSIYWVALVGHNGVMIAFWILISLMAAERGRAAWSGIAGALAFLTTKVLAVLSWPGIILYRRRGRIRRAIPLIAATGITLSLLLFDIDVFPFMHREFRVMTSGNVWFIVAKIYPPIVEFAAWDYLPPAVFAVLGLPMLVAFARRGDGNGGFDETAAFISATFLLFLGLSKVSHNYYIIMALIFIFHTVLVHYDGRVLMLLPLIFLSTITGLEQYLYYKWTFRDFPFTTGGGLLLFSLNILMVAAYACLAYQCFRASLGRRTAGLISG